VFKFPRRGVQGQDRHQEQQQQKTSVHEGYKKGGEIKNNY